LIEFERWKESLENHTKEQLAKVSGTSMAMWYLQPTESFWGNSTHFAPSPA
jgi:hypothetical protein